MIRVIFIIAGLLFFFGAKAQDCVIKNINIIPLTFNTVIKNKSVLIQNGKIQQIDDFEKIKTSKNTVILNGDGKYLMPALADMHVHLPDEEQIEELLLSNVAAGIAHIRIMNSKVNQADLKNSLSQKQHLISPKIHYSHLVRRADTYTEAEADSLVQNVKESGVEFIKLLSLSNKATYNNLTNAANKYGVTICGHYPVYQLDGQSIMLDMEKVIKSNFKSIEHLAGYVWLQDAKQIEHVLRLTKDYEIYNCPTLDWDILASDLLFPDEYKSRLTYQFLPHSVTKDWESNYLAAIEKAGGRDKVLELKSKALPNFELKQRILKRLYDNDCLLLIGGDAGNDFQADGFNIYEEMINWRNAGLDNYTILKSATLTFSQFFNEQHLWGTIEIGKNAELIILSSNPLENIENIITIETTIIGEKIYNNRELMNRL